MLNKQVFRFFLNNMIDLAIVSLLVSELHRIGFPDEADLLSNIAVVVHRAVPNHQNSLGQLTLLKRLVKETTFGARVSFSFVVHAQLVSS